MICEYCGSVIGHVDDCPHDKIKEIKYRFRVGNITEEVMNDLINEVLDK